MKEVVTLNPLGKWTHTLTSISQQWHIKLTSISLSVLARENDWKRGGARNANREYRKGKEFYVKGAMY